MILQLVVGAVAVASVRAWRRQRAADRDMARRIVARPPLVYVVPNPADRALTREMVRAAPKSNPLNYYAPKGVRFL